MSVCKDATSLVRQAGVPSLGLGWSRLTRLADIRESIAGSLSFDIDLLDLDDLVLDKTVLSSGLLMHSCQS